jgi:hypothetical protein
MSDPSMSDEVFRSLCEKLTKADLTPEERELLNGILKIVWDVAGPSGSPDKEFDGCFEPGEAALIGAYLKAPSETTVSKSVDGATVSRGGLKSITGGGTPPPSPSPS